jgi:acyl dehydratase
VGGRTVEDVPVGRRVRFCRTVGESDVYLFAGITGDLDPNHVQELVPAAPRQELLDRLVAEGRALAPTVGGPPPMPPVIGDPTTDAAAALARARDAER